MDTRLKPLGSYNGAALDIKNALPRVPMSIARDGMIAARTIMENKEHGGNLIVIAQAMYVNLLLRFQQKACMN